MKVVIFLDKTASILELHYYRLYRLHIYQQLFHNHPMFDLFWKHIQILYSYCKLDWIKIKKKWNFYFKFSACYMYNGFRKYSCCNTHLFRSIWVFWFVTCFDFLSNTTLLLCTVCHSSAAISFTEIGIVWESIQTVDTSLK